MRAHWIVSIILALAVSASALAESKSGITVSSGVTNLQANWFSSNGSSLQRMLYLGAGVALYGKYIHFDLDGYYGTAGIKNDRLADGSLDQYGALASFGGHLPIRTGKVLIQPQLGVGYGLMFLSYGGMVSPAARATIPVGSSQLLHGGFLVPGLVIEPWRWLVLYGDFAFSFFSTSERKTSLAGVGIPVPSQGSGFERIRAGAAFRIGQGFTLGLQFVQRTSHFGVFATSGEITPVQQHYLGTVGLEF